MSENGLNIFANIVTQREEISTSRFTIDHIKPRSLDGTDDVNNMALACSRCNQRRYNFTVASDLETQAEVALFNPRSQQ